MHGWPCVAVSIRTDVGKKLAIVSSYIIHVASLRKEVITPINAIILSGYIFVLQMLFKEVYRKGTVQSTFSQQSDKSAGGAVNTT